MNGQTNWKNVSTKLVKVHLFEYSKIRITGYDKWDEIADPGHLQLLKFAKFAFYHRLDRIEHPILRW